MKKFICKYCQVDVLSSKDHRAILGQHHRKFCPRKLKKRV